MVLSLRCLDLTRRPRLGLQEAGAAAVREWKARLSYYVYETVGSLRIADMFDIVVDYPDRCMWGHAGWGMCGI